MKNHNIDVNARECSERMKRVKLKLYRFFCTSGSIADATQI